MTVYDVVSKLIGKVSPCGDTNIDKERLEHLEEEIDLIYYLVDDVWEASISKDRKEYSMHEVGTKAYTALVDLSEYLKTRIRNVT